jgi:hypothetical protein
MSARSIISHRLFVAALSHDPNGTAGSRQPERAPNSGAGHTGPDRAVSPEYRAPSRRAMAARQMLSAVLSSGL